MKKIYDQKVLEKFDMSKVFMNQGAVGLCMGLNLHWQP